MQKVWWANADGDVLALSHGIPRTIAQNSMFASVKVWVCIDVVIVRQSGCC